MSHIFPSTVSSSQDAKFQKPGPSPPPAPHIPDTMSTSLIKFGAEVCQSTIHADRWTEAGKME